MGTPDFAVPSLTRLLDAGCDIRAVVTAPDRPRGRGRRVTGTPVRAVADARGLPVLQPVSLKDDTFVEELRAFDPDLIIVVAFRILPPPVFTLPRLGSFNLHASLLPRYRGAAPINWALINGERETGVTTFFLKEKVDTGNMLLQQQVSIGDDDDAGILHDRLALAGADLVLRTVRLIEQGKAEPRPQDDRLASPAPKIFHQDCLIDWRQPSQVIRNRIRGLSPSPGAFTTHAGRVIKIYRAVAGSAATGDRPGTVRSDRGSLSVAAGDGWLDILELQQEGKKRMSVEEFLRGYTIRTGERVGEAKGDD